jgi:hypothetical protein
VLAYDLARDGSAVYSNGGAIFRLPPDGKPEPLHVKRLIEQVVVLA